MKRKLKRIAAFILCILQLTCLVGTGSLADEEKEIDRMTGGYAESVSKKYIDFFGGVTYKYLNDDSFYSSNMMYSSIVNDTFGYVSVKWGLGMMDEELDYESCIRVLATIIQMQENGFTSSYANLSQYDSLKSVAEYGMDIIDIVAGSIAVEGIKGDLGEKISDVLGVSIDLAGLTFDTLEEYKFIDSLLSGYENHAAFLRAVRDNTKILDEMREAAGDMLDIVHKSAEIRLEAVKNLDDSVMELAMNDVFSDALLDALKSTDTYANDQAVRAILDWSEEQKSMAMSTFGAASTIYKLDMLAGDMLFGTTDIYKRFAEIEALYWVTNAVQDEIGETVVMSSDPYKNLEHAREVVPLFQYLILLRMRSEYCLQQMVYQDAQAFSLIKLMFDDTDAAVDYYLKMEEFFDRAWKEVSAILDYEWEGGSTSEGDFMNKLAELTAQYGVISIGTEDYTASDGYSSIPKERITGLLSADIYDYDRDGADELVTVRFEDNGGDEWADESICYISVYENSGGEIVLSDEKQTNIMSLRNMENDSSVQLSRYTDESGETALYLDFFNRMINYSFGVIKISYNGTSLGVVKAVNGSEFEFDAGVFTSESDDVLQGVWNQEFYHYNDDDYGWAVMDDVKTAKLEQYRETYRQKMNEMNLDILIPSGSYLNPDSPDVGEYTPEREEEFNKEVEALEQFYYDDCVRRTYERFTPTDGGELTELCGILAPTFFNENTVDSGMGFNYSAVRLICFDSSGVLDNFR